jgi:2-amino-4-hydroxy-6-hydroxymethyldihydropteridine pyrophosphokinase
MEKVYVLFGSNMGDKMDILAHAQQEIEVSCGKIIQRSSLYESQPWGFTAQEWFLNQLLIVETMLSSDDFMKSLLNIENDLGRVRDPSISGYSSRTIDLDILYFGEQVLSTPLVIAPHPRLHLRRFVLLPLCELVPDFIHPTLNLSQKQLLDSCPDKLKVRIL